jgi:predicted peroxiredoxin
MFVKKAHKPKIHWDQTAFKKLKATWSPERIDEDNETLDKIFALAADCPLLAEALDWAKEHGIKFFVDRTAVKLGGYYAQGGCYGHICSRYRRSGLCCGNYCS